MSLVNINIIIEEELAISEIVNPQSDKKDFRDINYNNELISGIKLHPVFTFGLSGLLESTIYYNGFVDMSNKGEEILRSDISWVVDNDEVIPSAKSIVERTTTRKWKKKGGGYSNKQKVTPKKYDTNNKKNDAGSRMRLNLRRDAEQKLGTAIYLCDLDINGAPTLNPTDEMTSFLEFYTNAFYTWHITGKGTIYDDILNDNTKSWMDWVVPDNVSTQAMIPFMIGVSIRDYSVSKFKGEII